MKFCCVWGLAFALALLGSLVSSAQGVDCRTNYFKVTGTNFHEIRRSMAKSRPWREEFDAMTAWQVNWKFNHVGSESGCRCTGFTTIATIVITMPWWVAPTNASVETKTRWTNYYQQLGAHEAGHARIALAANAEIRKQLSQITSAPDCAALQTRINEAANRVLAEHRDREREFDRRTRHGAEPATP